MFAQTTGAARASRRFRHFDDLVDLDGEPTADAVERRSNHADTDVDVDAADVSDDQRAAATRHLNDGPNVAAVAVAVDAVQRRRRRPSAASLVATLSVATD